MRNFWLRLEAKYQLFLRTSEQANDNPTTWLNVTVTTLEASGKVCISLDLREKKKPLQKHLVISLNF